MVLSDISVRRPVFAAVISLLLVAFGILAYERLALREYPDIDPPIVSVDTSYVGASAAVVETRITEIIEDRIAGVEGIKQIESTSEDGRSRVTIEFDPGRDIDGAANDIRDRVSGVLDNLPEEADPPEIQKVESDDDVIMWLNLTSTNMDTLELTDYARRYLQDQFSILPGVARVRLGGGLEYAMRVWVDRKALAAHGLTVVDIENALRSENIELPAGRIESNERVFAARVLRGYRTPADFNDLVIGRSSAGGHLVRLAEVARVERGAVEDRVMFRGNTVDMVGMGIIKQSTANTIDVARAAKALKDKLAPNLPEGMSIEQSYDSSVFIEASIAEVWKTLAIAIGLVVLVIWLFLGSVRAMLIPAVTVPVSLVATFIALYAFGFTLNLLTLLAMVLAVGLVVDDSIVMLENIARRVEMGESPLVAAYRGAKQVGFAVIATSVVLIAVFVPLSFVPGDIGRLFTEFALTMAAAVFFSTLVALTLSPMLCSKLLRNSDDQSSGFSGFIDRSFSRLSNGYGWLLERCLQATWLVGIVVLAVFAAAGWLYKTVPGEYTPREDRGAFFLIVSGPEGASYDYMRDYMDEIEARTMPLVENGEVQRLLVRAPSFGGERFNSGIVIFVLRPWAQRRSAWEIMDDVRARTSDLPGVRAFPIMRQGLGGGRGQPVQFVLGGGTYEQLTEWRDTLLAAIDERMTSLRGVDTDYKETQPQLRIEIDRNRAGDLGVSVRDIGLTLQTMMGSRRVTTYLDDGEEYDVIVEGERDLQRTQNAVANLYVRSTTTGNLVPLSNLVRIREQADAYALNRYNRVRAITIQANLAEGVVLGDALAELTALAREVLPDTVVIDYKGQSGNLQESGGSLGFVFVIGLVVVFLVLAAQFESFVHPAVIMLCVPLAVAGALLGLWLTGSSLNIYSQIGLVMLIGLAAKNGILIVEFANQRRDAGLGFDEALLEAARVRFRPIVMTAVTTIAGALPLVLSSGAGAETRFTIGVVIMSGVLAATVFTVFVVPVAYALLARKTTSPEHVSQTLDNELAETPMQS